MVSSLYLHRTEFTRALCPFKYKWNNKLSNTRESIDIKEHLNMMNEENNIEDLEYIQETYKFAVNITLMELGEFTLILNVSDQEAKISA